MKALPYQAIIFDMDGLVLDSESTYLQAWQAAADAMGLNFDLPFLNSLSGLHGADVEKRLLQYTQHDFDLQHFKHLSGSYWRYHVEQYGIPVKPGLFQLLELAEAFKLPYCLATNSRKFDAEYCLALADIRSHFPIMICREDVANAKPAPDIFLKAAEILGKDIQTCLVLEDSAVGVAAASAANAPCFYVPSVYPADDQAQLQALAVYPDLQCVADRLIQFQ